MAPDTRKNPRQADDTRNGTHQRKTDIRHERHRAAFTPHMSHAFQLTCLATPTVVGQVRLTLGYRMIEWGLSSGRFIDFCEDLRLIASELLANAIDRTPDQVIQIECAPDFQHRRIRFAVWDSSNKKPRARMPILTLESLDLSPEHADDNGGWGLPMVQQLTESHGVTPTEHGKWVWAILKVRD